MVKWDLLEKFKIKTEPKIKETTKPEANQEPEKIKLEYHETLFSGKTSTRKESSHLEKNKINSKQRIWRNLNIIEENINGLNRSKANTGSSDLDGKIDRLLASKQKK